MSSTWREKSYRWIAQNLLTPALVGNRPSDSQWPLRARSPGVKRVWVHAASVGEWESLLPVVEHAIKTTGFEFVVTCLSASAIERVLAFQKECEILGHSHRCVYAGYSPLEGQWAEALHALSPDLWMTAKYEAWPELWSECARRGIEVVVVAAQKRSSLVWASRMGSWLGSPAPKLHLWTAREESNSSLRELFSDADIRTLGEPRWDRVAARRELKSAGRQRAEKLAEEGRLLALPTPWGVVGSAWPSDFTQALVALRSRERKGTLWIFPHEVNAPSVDALTSLLSTWGWSWCLSGSLGTRRGEPPAAVIVNEMGLLAEFYRYAQWAHVGGGFHEGVHSTIEPALAEIPVICGPARFQAFPETHLLQKMGQLTCVNSAAEWLAWWDRERAVGPEENGRRRELWREAHRRERGAAERVCSELAGILEQARGNL